MKRPVAAFLLLLLASIHTSPSEGHGPIYRPPPPPWGGPGDVHGGPQPNGPQGGRSGGPSTPGPSAPPAPAPTGPNRPGGPGAAVTQIGGGAPDLSDWNMWWGFNSDPYLDLRQIVRSSGPITGSDDFFLGQWGFPRVLCVAPTDEVIAQRVGPALQRAIEAEFDDRVLCDAMLALAKLHPTYVPVGEHSMNELFARYLDHSNHKVVDSAIVALGLMADPACAFLLASLACDDASGRKLVGHKEVPSSARALAALSLGLVGANNDREDLRRYIVFHLVQILDGEAQASPELFVACVSAMGLTPLADSRRKEREEADSPTASRQGQIAWLVELLRDEKRHAYVRAHVPCALGRLIRGADDPEKEEVALALLDQLRSRRKTKRLVRYGIVEALGQLGDADEDETDERILETLRKSVREGDNFERQLGLLGIALVSSRPGTGEGQPLAATGDARSYLLEQHTRGRSQLRPWAALALGLQGFHLREAGVDVDPATTRTLQQSLSIHSAAGTGAWCLALGLRGDLESAPMLLERLEDAKDDTVMSRTAIALGLLGAREAVPVLQDIIADSTYHPVLMRETAIALGLLGDKNVITDLIDVMGTSATTGKFRYRR